MDYLKKLTKEKRNLLIIAIISALMAIAWDFSKKDKEAKEVSQDEPTADTYVPDGFVLVPIEVQNAESLNAILGSYGVVDIFYPPSESNPHARLIARQVKILRAPLNPQKFAVLVPSDQSQNLVKIDIPLFVTVHNPKNSKTRFINNKKLPARFEYESL